VYQDSQWDFTRPEFLWQVLGNLVFPDADMKDGIPQIDGDLRYRTFLIRMVQLLLQGATKTAMAGGIEALDPNVTAQVLEKFLASPPRDPTGLWTIDNQFEVEVFVSGPNNTFPSDPFALQENAKIVLGALKPAHVIWSYSHLFTEAFGTICSDDGGISLDLESYYYDDTRKWCLGAKAITGIGDTPTTRTLFIDPTVSFLGVRAGAILTIGSGLNAGQHYVDEVLTFPYGSDSIARTYTTAPTGLSGNLTVFDDTLVDALQNWGQAVDGELVTIDSGPNAGTYRLDVLLGSQGGQVGISSGPATRVRCSPGILKVARRMAAVVSAQNYIVDVDRLGVRIPHAVGAENASDQFYL
jgi:hypothetical protein